LRLENPHLQNATFSPNEYWLSPQFVDTPFSFKKTPPFFGAKKSVLTLPRQQGTLQQQFAKVATHRRKHHKNREKRELGGG